MIIEGHQMAFKIPLHGTESLAEGYYETMRQLRTNVSKTTFEIQSTPEDSWLSKNNHRKLSFRVKFGT